MLPQRYEQQWSNDAEDRRIYFMGSGAVGTFVAHQLAGLPDPPPITLLLHWGTALSQWRKVGQKLTVTREGLVETRENIDRELLRDPREDPATDESPPIRQLIVAVKAQYTVSALSRIAHRLDRTSTIVFLQNGRGITDELDAEVFRDEATRPRYILGTVTHGLYRESTFNVAVRGPGTITLSLQPNMTVEEWETGRPADVEDQRRVGLVLNAFPPTARYLLRTITRAPLLRAAGADPWDGLKISLVKLAQNGIVNPLTALFDCSNGELLDNPPTSRLMHLLLGEMSAVFRAMPETAPIKTRDALFSPHKLRSEVLEICRNTAANTSSMLQDIRAGRETEIDYINGWIVRRGGDLGITCLANFQVQQMVKAKSLIHNASAESGLPLEIDAETKARMNGSENLPKA